MTILAAVISGLLLFASDHPVRAWWLQFVAFVPFWWALDVRGRRGAALWTVGFWSALGNGLPLVIAAGTAAPVVAAAGAMVLQWTVVAALAGRVLRRGGVLGAMAAAGVVTLAEIAMWYGVPVFGTAQCCVRPLSAAPMLVAFVAFTGVGGLVFVITGVQALVVSAVRGPHRAASLGAAVAIVALCALLDAARWQRDLGPVVRVAAAGWRELGFRTDDAAFYDDLFEVAGRQRAALLVTPETGVTIGAPTGAWPTREAARTSLGRMCESHGVAVAMGFWCAQNRDNRLWLIDGDGVLAGEYRKTHLVPFFESYESGDGSRATMALGEVVVGAMICQDDNFTDLGRGYGTDGATIVAVPTNDWPDIREYHLENGVFRAIENGYAIVRGASGGISAIVSPRGEIVRRHDHFEDGECVIVADVSTGDGEPTPYATFGDLPIVILAGVVCLGSLALGRPRGVEPGVAVRP